MLQVFMSDLQYPENISRHPDSPGCLYSCSCFILGFSVLGTISTLFIPPLRLQPIAWFVSDVTDSLFRNLTYQKIIFQRNGRYSALAKIISKTCIDLMWGMSNDLCQNRRIVSNSCMPSFNCTRKTVIILVHRRNLRRWFLKMFMFHKIFFSSYW